MRNKIKGALVGVAFGDAFGMPSEMWSREMIKRELGEVDRFLPGHSKNEISRGFSAGEVTDDTSNTIMVIEMLSENNGKVEPMEFIKKLRAWAQNEAKSKNVIGPSTKRAFQLLDEGYSMDYTGRQGFTNGGAMKILPVGIVCANRPLEYLIDQVEKLCLPTHNTGCAIASASAIAGATAKAIEGEKNLKNILSYALEAARIGENRGYSICSASVPKRIELALKIAEQEKKPEKILQEIYDYIGTGLSSSESIPAALALVLLSDGNPLVCARYAANIGGDTDTIGAMACGICGAFAGDGVFEQKDIYLLEQVNKINFEELTDQLESCMI